VGIHDPEGVVAFAGVVKTGANDFARGGFDGDEAVPGVEGFVGFREDEAMHRVVVESRGMVMGLIPMVGRFVNQAGHLVGFAGEHGADLKHDLEAYQTICRLGSLKIASI